MDTTLAVERHRKQLARIVATLFAMIGLVEGVRVDRLSLPIYRKVLRLLRPAESAVRRLIVVVADGVVLKPPAKRSSTPTTPRRPRKGRTPITFKLFDARQRFGSAFRYERSRHRINLVQRPEPRPEPRIRVISFDPRTPLFRQPFPVQQESTPVAMSDGSVNAIRICRRLAAIKSALEDLPRQARRYARWQSKPQAERRPQFASALRPGTPPGHRKNPIHKVDETLLECDWLARQVRHSDTS